MVSEIEKQLFLERVDKLRINPDALEEVRVHFVDSKVHVIPNSDKTRNSLMIYANATSNDGYISPVSAEKILELFGKELTEDAYRHPGKHPNIDIAREIELNGNKVRLDVVRRNSAKPVPEHVVSAIENIKKYNPTPFYVYDEDGIATTADKFNDAFSWVPNGFKNYFAVKALPNPEILKLLKEKGFGADCSSLPELMIANKSGMFGEEIMFTSNDTPDEEFVYARGLEAILNLDDISHIDRLKEAVGNRFPQFLSFRYNPGPLRGGNEIIGEPHESKYGLTTEQIFEAYKIAKEMGVSRFGLHTMVVSNMLDEQYLIENGRMVIKLGAEISRELGIKFDRFNFGGGVGTPYRPEQIKVDLQKVSNGLKNAYYENGFGGDHSPKVVMECGRAITGPHGFLVSEVRHVTKKYKNFVGLDASMANLMRPGMYGAYHHITVLGKEEAPQTQVYDVTGSLCENNDKFAVNRLLPEIERGNVFIIHNGGAHGHAMGFQYNGKLRCAEFLADKKGDYRIIRRAETVDDYFATLNI